MQLEYDVSGITGRRWDTQRASEGAHLAGKPIKLEPSAVFEIVCHRGFPIGSLVDRLKALDPNRPIREERTLGGCTVMPAKRQMRPPNGVAQSAV
jgi:hypothetical protein